MFQVVHMVEHHNYRPTHENPFQMTSAGLVTRKTGVHINSDLINEYQYTVIVKDNFNTASNEAIVTIPIDDDTPASISTNGTFRIVESIVSGMSLEQIANGFSGTQTRFKFKSKWYFHKLFKSITYD